MKIDFPWDEREITDEELFATVCAGCIRELTDHDDSASRRKAVVDHFAHRDTPVWYDERRSSEGVETWRANLDDSQIEEIIREADGLVAHRFELAGTIVDLGPDLAWHTAELSEHSSTSLNFKRMRYLITLAEAFLLTDRERYLTTLTDILDRYLEEWPLIWEDRSPDAFIVQREPVQEAMSTAFRVLTWIELLYTPVPYDSRFGFDLAFRMIRSIWFTAHQYRRFDDDEFMEANHHLFERGVAPFQFALLLPEFPEIAAMANRAREVAATHVAHDFLEDGSYLEPSVPYTIGATLELMYGRAEVLARQNGTHFLTPPGLARIERGFDLMFRIVEPSGTFPPIGDDLRRAQRWFPDWVDRGWFADTTAAAIAASLGLITSRPDDLEHRLPPTFGLFAEAGYATDRTDWTATADYYVMSINTRGLWRHGHLDMLSLIVAVGGRIMFDESAAAYYKHSHAGGTDGTVARGHLVNLSSHNTILAWGGPIEDDICYSTDWNAISPRVTVEHADSRADWSYLRASHTGYPSVVCRRELLSARGHGWLIRDEVAHRSPPPGMYHLQRWHLAPEASLERIDDTCVMVSHGESRLLCVWPLAEGVAIQIHREIELEIWTDNPPVVCDVRFPENGVNRSRALPAAFVPLWNEVPNATIESIRTTLLDPLLLRNITPEDDGGSLVATVAALR